MAAIIKSVSITQEEEEFLKEYNLSPSQLLKEAIWTMKGFHKKLAQDKIERLTKLLAMKSRECDELREKCQNNSG